MSIMPGKLGAAMDFNAVKQKRKSNIQELFATDKNAEPEPTSGDRMREIENIKKMLENGEARPSLINRTSYKRINKRFD